MKRNFTRLLLASGLAIGFILKAQKIDLDKVTIKNQFIKLPENGKLIHYATYAANPLIDNAIISQRGYTGNKVEGFVELTGYGYSADQSDFTYTLKVQKPLNLSSTVEEKKVDVKNAAGQMVTQTKYVGKIRQSVPSLLLISNSKTSEEIYKIEFGGANDPFEVVSQDFDTRAQAEAFLNVKDGVMHATVSNNFQARLDTETGRIKKLFNVKLGEENDTFWKVDLEKAPDYAQLNKDLEKAKLILEKQSYNESLDRSRNEMAPIIASWTEGISKIKLDEKKAKKLRYAYLLNIAKAQFWLEQFDDCEKTCQQIIANDYDEGDGKELLRNIATVKAELKAAGVTSRHFYRKGFEMTAKYEFGSMTKKQFNEIKAGAEDVRKSTVELKKEVKELTIRKTVKDSLKYNESDLSDLQYVLNSEALDLTHRELSEGYAEPVFTDSTKTSGYYYVNINRNRALTKKGSLTGFGLKLYPNKTFKGVFTADSMIKVLKQFNKSQVAVFYTEEREKLNSGEENKKHQAMLDKFKANANKLTLSGKISYQVQQTLVDQVISHVDMGTKKDQKISIEFVEAVPIKFKTVPAEKMSKNGYLVTLKLSQLEYAELGNMEYSADPNHNEVFKDIKCTFLMTSY